jgi:hypothetical protein
MVYYTGFDEEFDRDEDPTNVNFSGGSQTADSQGSVQKGNPAQTNTGSGFQNLDRYLQANAPKQFGQQVLGKVGDEVQKAGENQQAAGERFGQQVQQANTLPTEQQIDTAIEKPKEADKDAFQDWMKQKYTGPNNIAESQDIYNQFWSGTQQAGTRANLLGTEAGRFSLLDSYFGKPNYSFGQKSLDNLLVQESGLGKETRDLRNQATQLKTTGNQQAKQLSSLAGQRAADVDASRQLVRGRIGLDDQGNVITGDNAGAIGKKWSEVDQAVKDANAERHQINNLLLNDLKTGKLSYEDMAKLGLTDGMNLYGLNLDKYYTAGADLTKNQVMTPEQQAQIQALSELAGITDTYAQGTLGGKTDPFTFNTDRLLQDISGTEAEYNRMLSEQPVEVGNPAGQPQMYTLGRLGKEIAAAQANLASGSSSSPKAAESFLRFAIPAYEKAKQDLAAKYKIDNKLSGYRKGPEQKYSVGPVNTRSRSGEVI